MQVAEQPLLDLYTELQQLHQSDACFANSNIAGLDVTRWCMVESSIPCEPQCQLCVHSTAATTVLVQAILVSTRLSTIGAVILVARYVF